MLFPARARLVAVTVLLGVGRSSVSADPPAFANQNPWPALAVFELDPPLSRVDRIGPVLAIARKLDAALQAQVRADGSKFYFWNDVFEMKSLVFSLELGQARLQRDRGAILAVLASQTRDWEQISSHLRATNPDGTDVSAITNGLFGRAQQARNDLIETYLVKGADAALARSDYLLESTLGANSGFLLMLQQGKYTFDAYSFVTRELARGEIFVASLTGSTPSHAAALTHATSQASALRRHAFQRMYCFSSPRYDHTFVLAEELLALARLPRPAADRLTGEALTAAALHSARDHLEVSMEYFGRGTNPAPAIMNDIFLLVRAAFAASQFAHPDERLIEDALKSARYEITEVIIPTMTARVKQDPSMHDPIAQLYVDLLDAIVRAWSAEFDVWMP